MIAEIHSTVLVAAALALCMGCTVYSNSERDTFNIHAVTQRRSGLTAQGECKPTLTLATINPQLLCDSEPDAAPSPAP